MEGVRASSSLEKLKWFSKMFSAAASKGADVERDQPQAAAGHYSQALGYYQRALELSFSPGEREEAAKIIDKMEHNKALVESRVQFLPLQNRQTGSATRLPPPPAGNPPPGVLERVMGFFSSAFEDKQEEEWVHVESPPSSSSSLPAVVTPAPAPASALQLPSTPKTQPRQFVVPMERKSVPPLQQQPAGPSTKQPPPAQKAAPPSNELQGIDKEMQRKILDVAVDSSPGVAWDDISGLDAAKRALYEIVILPSLRPEFFTGIRQPPSGILLFGPPGCGKTMLAKAVASEAKCAFFSISASSLMSKYLGESEGLVKALFSVARYVAPSVIFIDEIDALLSERSDKEHEASRRVKTEFLVQWDGIQANQGGGTPKRILVMGATNRPYDLDDAAIRRMPTRVYIPLPDDATRRGAIVKLVSSTKNSLSAQDFSWISASTEGYSQSDLKALCQQAAMEPLRELGNVILTVQPEQVRGVERKDFAAALKVARPSVPSDSLRLYEEWSKKYGFSN